MRLIAVVRANGERTEEVAIAMAREQLQCPLHVLHIRPFVDAVRECFRIAMEADADWLMTIDADTLTLPKAIPRLIERAERMPPDVAQYQGKFKCKLAGGKRKGGHRMYRVEHLPAALDLLQPAERVESDMLRVMERRGLRSIHNLDIVTGVHDHWQFYRDIWAKARVHSQKHQKWHPVITNRWQESEDPDLRCAWAGWRGVPFDVPEKLPLAPGWRPKFQ